MAGTVREPLGQSLEQAWHFLMASMGLRNSFKAAQAEQTRRVLNNLMRHRQVWK